MHEPQSRPDHRSTWSKWARCLLLGSAIGVLAGVFLMYLQPQMRVLLVNELWNCF